MKHAFHPASSLFYVSLIASSYPSLSFRFEILENLKLTKEGTSKVRARAAPGLSANRTQRLGSFAAIPAKNLSSSLNGSHFLPEEPSSHPASRGRGVSPTSSLSPACEAAAGTGTGLQKVSPAPSHQPRGAAAAPGRTAGPAEKPRATPVLTFHFQSLQRPLRFVVSRV